MAPKSGPKSDQKVVQKMIPKMTKKWSQKWPDASPRIRVQFVKVSRAQMGPSGMVWESSATGLGRTGQPKSQANRKALQGPYKAL